MANWGGCGGVGDEADVSIVVSFICFSLPLRCLVLRKDRAGDSAAAASDTTKNSGVDNAIDVDPTAAAEERIPSNKSNCADIRRNSLVVDRVDTISLVFFEARSCPNEEVVELSIGADRSASCTIDRALVVTTSSVVSAFVYRRVYGVVDATFLAHNQTSVVLLVAGIPAGCHNKNDIF
jgi:hypothetical protein